MIKYSPCYKCTERHDLCHSDCKKYKAYKQNIKSNHKAKKDDVNLDTYFIEAVKRRNTK